MAAWKIISFARGGEPAWDCGLLDASRDLVYPASAWRGYQNLLRPADRLSKLLLHAHGDLPVPPGGAPCLALEEVRVLPPVPDAPVVWANHGNTPMVWKVQESKENRWKLPRVPYFRVRPAGSVAGDPPLVSVGRGFDFVHGVELALVIGRPGRGIPEARAAEHIAGWMLLNDGFVAGVIPAVCGARRPDPMEKQSLDTISKAADAATWIGPWITPFGQVKDPGDILLETLADGRVQKRGWTGSYLMTAEYLIAQLSRLGVLQTGTIISLGAAGWDGCRVALPAKSGAKVRLGIGGEGLGRMQGVLQRVRRNGGPAGPPPNVRSVWMQPVAEHFKRATRPPLARPLLHPEAVAVKAGAIWSIPRGSGKSRLALRVGLVIPRAFRPGEFSGLDPGFFIRPCLQIHSDDFAPAVQAPTPYEQRAMMFLGSSHAASLALLDEVAAGGAGPEFDVRLSLGKTRAQAKVSAASILEELAGMIRRVNLVATVHVGDLFVGSPLFQPVVLPASRKNSLRVGWSFGRAQGRLRLEDLRDRDWADEETR